MVIAEFALVLKSRVMIFIIGYRIQVCLMNRYTSTILEYAAGIKILFNFKEKNITLNKGKHETLLILQKTKNLN